jgi:hypothetical protein
MLSLVEHTSMLVTEGRPTEISLNAVAVNICMLATEETHSIWKYRHWTLLLPSNMLDMSVIMLVSQSSIGPYSVQNEVIIANPKTNPP